MSVEKKDWCTGFPEYWYTWTGKRIEIGDLCKKHDERCGTHGFYRDTWEAHLIGATLIATVATVACWVKYFKLMWSKI